MYMLCVLLTGSESVYLFLSTPSVAPRVVARSPSVHEDGESLPIPMVTLDHALPVTSLQIWLADGRRLVQRFNLSHRCVSQCQGLNTSLSTPELDVYNIFIFKTVQLWLYPCKCTVCKSPNLKHRMEEVVQGLTKDFCLYLLRRWGGVCLRIT